MKKLFLSLLLMATMLVGAQSSATYPVSSAAITNPERGLYKHTEVFTSNYTVLNQTALNGYRTDGYSLILRVIYMDSFLTTPTLSSTFLTNLNTDFARTRTAGLKMIVRFAYSDDDNAGTINPTKSIILSHITALKPTLETNKDVIAVFQAGFIGSYGEWYRTDYFGTGNSSLTTTNISDRTQIVNHMLANFPVERQIQMRTPRSKQRITGSLVPLSAGQAYTNTTVGRLAHHNDCFLADGTDMGTYGNVTTEKAYLAQENKYLAMGGETCQLNTTYTNCANAVAEMDLLSFDYLNSSYNEDVTASWVGVCSTEIANRLGYRFELISTNLTATTATISLRNTGFGHLYNPRKVYVVYKNTSSGAEYPVQLQTDPRLWLKGSTITLVQSHPTTLPSGEYDLFLSMPDQLVSGAHYAIQFANTGVWNGTTGYNALGVKHTVGTPTPPPTIPAVSLYLQNNNTIVPTVTNYTIQIFNNLNALVGTTPYISSLPAGTYTAKITVAGIVYTQNFVKN